MFLYHLFLNYIKRLNNWVLVAKEISHVLISVWVSFDEVWICFRSSNLKECMLKSVFICLSFAKLAQIEVWANKALISSALDRFGATLDACNSLMYKSLDLIFFFLQGSLDFFLNDFIDFLATLINLLLFLCWDLNWFLIFCNIRWDKLRNYWRNLRGRRYFFTGGYSDDLIFTAGPTIVMVCVWVVLHSYNLSWFALHHLDSLVVGMNFSETLCKEHPIDFILTATLVENNWGWLLDTISFLHD